MVFDADKICEGYEVVFRDDYAMELNGSVVFRAYTIYRDPQNTHVDETDETKNIYSNGARSVNWQTDASGNRTYFYLFAADRYKMLPYTEELRIQKTTGGNSATEIILSEANFTSSSIWRARCWNRRSSSMKTCASLTCCPRS